MTTEEARETVQAFADRIGVTMTATRIPRRPDAATRDDPKWDATAGHWQCVLSAHGRSMPVTFSKGSACFDKARTFGHRKMKPIRFMDRPKCDGCFKAWPCDGIITSSAASAQPEPPALAEVLDCLASDSESYDSARTFEEWAGDYGYDTDSRRAERMYREISEQAHALRLLLGAAEYEHLTTDTERL